MRPDRSEWVWTAVSTRVQPSTNSVYCWTPFANRLCCNSWLGSQVCVDHGSLDGNVCAVPATQLGRQAQDFSQGAQAVRHLVRPWHYPQQRRRQQYVVFLGHFLSVSGVLCKGNNLEISWRPLGRQNTSKLA